MCWYATHAPPDPPTYSFPYAVPDATHSGPYSAAVLLLLPAWVGL